MATARLRCNTFTLLLTDVRDVLLSLVDALRCPAEHEASPLVLAAEAWSEGRVSAGFLGCPVCHARYAIRDGVADFTRGRTSGGSARSPSAATVSDGTRLAAQLGLADGGGLVLLTADYATQSPAISAIADVTCLLVDAGLAISPSTQSVGIRMLDRMPLVDGSLRAAAVDLSRGSPSFLSEVARCVRDGGRLVAPAGSTPPGTVRILARDDREWVGQVERPAALITPLRRASP